MLGRPFDLTFLSEGQELFGPLPGGEQGLLRPASFSSGVAEPRGEIGFGERELELAEGGEPNGLEVHTDVS